MRALMLLLCAVGLAGLAGYALSGSLQFWAAGASIVSILLAAV